MNYSKVLVALQFVSIAVIVFSRGSHCIFPYWWILSLIGAIFSIWIFMHNRVGNFNIIPEIRDNAKLITTGPYYFVRHPMYSALIMFVLGMLLYKFSILNIVAYLFMIMAVYLKAKKEEILWKNHHDKYEDYMKSTKMIIPFVV